MWSDALKRLAPLVQQAEMLAVQYDAVVANPPYMGSKVLLSNALVKKFAKDHHYPDAKSPTSSPASCKRGLGRWRPSGCTANINAMVTGCRVG